MKKTNLLKSMLLLCALVAGSGSVWAVKTATLTGTNMLEGNGAVYTSYSYHTGGIFDDQGNIYTGNWCYQKNGSTPYNMIQLKKYAATDCSYLALPKFSSNIRTITITATTASETSSSGSGPKTRLRIVKGTSYNKTEADVAANQLFQVGSSSTATKPYTFDFTSLDTPYDGENLYIVSLDNPLRIWSIVVVTEDTNNPPAVSPLVTSYTETAIITSEGEASCSPTSTAIVTTKNLVTSGLPSGYNYGFKITGSGTHKVTLTLPSGATNAKVTFVSNGNTVPSLKIGTSKYAISWSGDAENGYTGTIGISESCDLIKDGSDLVVVKITLTYDILSETQVAVSTTANMDGWRAFYDGSQAYTADANTSVYVADSDPEGSTITLKNIGKGIPFGVPVILKTSAVDHKIVLTKGGSATYSGTNNLAVTDGTNDVSSKYRLGYNSTDGVGFYPYSATKPAAGIVYLNIDASAHALSIDFEEGDVTGIAEVSAKKEFKGEYFNLAGQRVDANHKGIVVVNGKKFFNK